MTTRDEVLDAIDRIEKSGGIGDVTGTARIELVTLPPQAYDGILDRLRAAYPQLLSSRGEPGERTGQRGAGVEAMRRAESQLSQQQSATAVFDRGVLEALRHAHQTTVAGRRELDELVARIDDAARGWDLGTAAGAREFQRYLLAKLDQIMRVVEDGNDDDAAKRELAAALAARYDEQADRPAPHRDDEQAPKPAAADPAPGPSPTPDPPTFAEPAYDPAGGEPYAEPAFTEPGYAAEPPQRSPAPTPSLPLGPGFGGGLPGGAGFGGTLPGAGLPEGFPLGGLPAARHREAWPPEPENPLDPADPADETPAPSADEETASPEPPHPDPTLVTLPDGETVHAGTPQLAAVLQAAVGGTPIGEAFGAQGITIPPPGTPVTAAVDQSRVSPGDVGMFTDRHAVVLGNGKALLDGQIQRIANVRGPSFLGWQHPPTPTEPATPRPPEPTGIRPPAGIAQPGR